MMSPADLSEMYAALGERVTPAAGAAFDGLLTLIDNEMQSGTYAPDCTLRYIASAATLAPGATVSVRGASWRVVEPPRRVADGHECVVGLIREAA